MAERYGGKTKIIWREERYGGKKDDTGDRRLLSRQNNSKIMARSQHATNGLIADDFFVGLWFGGTNFNSTNTPPTRHLPTTDDHDHGVHDGYYCYGANETDANHDDDGIILSTSSG